MSEELGRIEGMLAKLLKRQPAGGGDDLDLEGVARVPVDRVRREQRRAQAAEQALAEAQQLLEQLKSGYTSSLEALKTETAETVKGMGLRHQEDLALASHNFDPAGRAALRSTWETLPKDARGKAPSEWWSGVVEAQKAHAADPENTQAPEVPRTLAGYLPQPETTTTRARSHPKTLNRPAPKGDPLDAMFSGGEVPGASTFFQTLQQGRTNGVG